MQYTIRKIPREVDAALRSRARRERRSLNRVALDALTEGAGIERADIKRRNLADLSGRWKDDPPTDRALASLRRIDRALWK
jgi:plasmid stability protein